MPDALHSVWRAATRASAAAVCSLLAAMAAAQAAPAAPAPAAAPPAGAPPTAAPLRVTDLGTEERPMEFVANSLREGIEPMDADAAAAQAVKTAPSVDKAKAANEQARGAASEALVAVYPRLDLLGQYTRLSEMDPIKVEFSIQGSPPMTLQVKNPLLDQWLLEARVSYPVSDLFFTILPRYRGAQKAAEAQRYNASVQANTVALNAREAFYNYARTRATLLVARSSLAQTEAQLKDTQSLVAAGTVARVEQLRAEANVATARVAVARAEGAVAIARTSVRTLLHIPGDQDIAITDDFAQALPALTETKEQLLDTARQQRSELRSLSTLLQSQDENIRAYDGEKLPKLGVAAIGDLGNPNQRATSFERTWTPTWSLLATLRWSPNDVFTAEARSDQVGAQRVQTLADMSALEDALRSEVSQAYADYSTAQQALEASLSGIRAAEETYRVRREQFRAGAAVQTDVVIAESDLNRARLDLVNAAIDVRIARARLDHALERNTPPPS